MSRWPVAIFAAFLLTCPALAQPPAVDALGDPLPEGAIARLGTVRLRHAATVHRLAFSRDGSLLASAGEDLTVRVWDAATGKLVQTFACNPPKPPQVSGSFSALAFAPDGKALAAYSPADRILRVWDVALGKPTWQTDAPATLAELAFTPDGKTLAGAVTGKEPKIQLWSAGTGQELLSFAGSALHLAFSADGKALAGAGIGNAGGVRVWEVESGREVQQFPIPFAT